MERLYFKKCLFISEDNCVYSFEIDKNDRFFQYMKPYISQEKVESATNVPIDKIIIKDPDKTFFNKKIFTLQARMMAANDADVINSYSIVIDNVSFDITNAHRSCYNNGEWEISLGELHFPYHADISINEK